MKVFIAKTAAMLLIRGTQHAVNVPFSWGYVDKPQEGQTFLLFIPGQAPFPIDGIRYQEPETKFNIPPVMVGGQPRELEVHEVKFGFIPGVDQTAFRLRRRYRIIKGGHPQLILVHYSRGPMARIEGTLMNQAVRSYPLRTFNEPSVYVVGDKAGQKVFPPGSGGGPGMGGMGGGGMGGMGMPMGMGFNSPQAMVQQQNNNMAILDRRREQEQRARAGSSTRPGRIDDEDSGDENDTISIRALSMTRYRRNHDYMAEVFTYAAYNSKNNAPPPPTPYSIFDKADLESKAEKLKAELEALEARGLARKQAHATKPQDDVEPETGGDVSMATLES
ncbi:SWI/SNF and RSC complexes subunit ssr4 [Favolaschia claudopus]|uniref:SWI/SNF and RSC complexes subunit ssr4 n=1 Tax=Favolaschia claudopus TaxID=2862362 RepID=A0AAW0BXK1_9AGAR